MTSKNLLYIMSCSKRFQIVNVDDMKASIDRRLCPFFLYGRATDAREILK
jgi:hypothetical protein